MRLSLIFLMLVLLPVAAGLHAWLFCRENLPRMTEEAITRLQEAGVHDPVVDVRFFDIAVAGEAADPPSRERALAAIRELRPLRLLPGAERIHVVANVKAAVQGDVLKVQGWLPEGGEAAALTELLAGLRPDLKVDTVELMSAPEVRWPEGFKPPLTAGSPLLKPIVEKLRVPAELRIESTQEAIVLRGLLPEDAVKHEVVAALAEVAGAREVDPSALKASPHVLAAPFAVREHLAVFVREFFQSPSPRSFAIGADGVPHIAGAATRQMESRWLSLLRPVTGGVRVEARLTLEPSEFHFPGRQIQSALPEEQMEPLRAALKGFFIGFEPNSMRISPEEQTRLAELVPVLLVGGPGLRLVIGAHPDPAGSVAAENAIGKARAEAVLSFLIDQGVPSSDISAIVFDAVPVGSPNSPPLPRIVEILVK